VIPADRTYAFENALAVQRERLEALEAVLDPGTIRHLEASGVGTGWQCLEVGAGGGSIAAWLYARVGGEGRVVATDLDTTVLQRLSHANLDVQVHDVLTDDLPEGAFDLVHLRLLLAWLRDPRSALTKVVSALKPGGHLIAEEMEFASVAPDPRLDDATRTLFVRVFDAHLAVLAERNVFDHSYGRRVAGDLEEAGLAEVDSEGRTAMWRGGEPGGTVVGLTFVQLREPMIESGRVTAADVDRAIAICREPRLTFMSPIAMAAWGRRA
jgi:SAM-dependent methyltransferase